MRKLGVVMKKISLFWWDLEKINIDPLIGFRLDYALLLPLLMILN